MTGAFAVASPGCATIGEGEIERGDVTDNAVRSIVLPRGGPGALPPGWHEWRGFARSGVVAGIRLPEAFRGDSSEDQPEDAPEKSFSEVWRVRVGQGLSGVIAADGKVFCHARVDDDEKVTCHDAATGRVIWTHAYPINPWSQPLPAFGISGGPLATPTYAAGRLYTVGIHGHVFCLEAETGKVIFARTPQDLDGHPSTYFYGHASSPLVRGGKLYISYAGESSAGHVIALDADTGELRWRAIEETVAYTSPVLARIHETEQLIVRTWQRIVGLNPDTGEILWEYAAESSGIRRDCTTPLVVGELVFVTNNFHGTIALRVLKGEDGGLSVERLYRSGALACTTSSPVYHDGHLYGLHKRGRFVCMDALTGERRWGVRDFDEYLSMISFGARVLALDDEGKLAVLSLSPERYTVEASWKVGEYTWAHFGVDEDRIYFRDGEDLVSLE